MAPKIRKRLRDDTHPHAQFIPVALIGFLGADCFRFVDRAQALLDHLGSDNEIAACFVIKRHISRSPHSVQASRHADERARAAFVLLQKGLIAPVTFRAATYAAFARININQTAADAPYAFIGEAW